MSSDNDTPATTTPASRAGRESISLATAVRRFASVALSEKGVRREGVFALAAIAAMTFFACYLRMFSFGLYEDDLNQARFWAYSASEMRDYIARLFETGAGGRPLGLTFLRGGFWAGFNIGGLPFLYTMGFLVFVGNAFLTYKLAKIIAPAAIALLAAFVFVLFPADALKFTIVRGLAVQPSLTFGLGAMLFYAHRRYFIAYLFAALSVTVYEFGILPFFTAPFFVLESWRSKLRRVAMHAGVIFCVMGAIILVRLQYATGHLDELAPLSTSDLINRFFIAMTAGPWTSLKGFVTKPLAFFRDAEPWHALVFGAVAAITLVALRAFWRDDTAPKRNAGENRMSLSQRADEFFQNQNPGLMILIGVGAWVVAYAMAVSESRFPPTTELGRTTSVHTAATFGAAIAFAGVLWFITRQMERIGVSARKVAIPVIAVYFGVLGGFHAVVQSACVESWKLQKRWWRDIVAQMPDWQDGTVVVVDFDRAPNSRYVYTMSWATAVIAQNSFMFPKTWKEPPTVVFKPQLPPTAEVKNGKLWLQRRTTWPHDGRVYTTPINPAKFVFFSVEPDGSLKRKRQEFRYRGFKATPAAPGRRTDFGKKPLYKILIGEDDAAATAEK